MKTAYSEAKDMFVIDTQSKTPIGKAYDFVWNEDNGKLEALLLRKEFLSKEDKIVLPQDIIKISEQIYVNSIEAVTLVSELVRYENIFKEYYTLIGTPVYDEMDIYLGEVLDYYFDSASLRLTSIYLKGSSEVNDENLIIWYKNIVSISEEKIVVSSLTKKAGEFRYASALD